MSQSSLINKLLTKTVEVCPDNVALRMGNKRLSYQELECWSNRIANTLRHAGVVPGDRVALLSLKSPELIASFYGVLKAGSVCVPLDPNSPPSRAARIVFDCGPVIVITQSGVWNQLEESIKRRQCLILDRSTERAGLPETALTWNNVESESQHAPECRRSDSDLAYILYTSGSTGVPKGVMISHRNMSTFVNWAFDEFQVSTADRIAGVSPLHFDLSMFDLFVTAKAGACLDLAPSNYAHFPAWLAGWMAESRVTILYTVPSVLIMLLEHGELHTRDLSELRLILFAGEVFPPRPLAQLLDELPHVRFANLYGPTETNVCAYHRVDRLSWERASPLPLGRACPDAELFAITDRGGLVERPGEVGELVVRGPGVALGYWNDLALTEASFRSPLPSPQAHQETYRTGDYVTIDDERRFIFRGRRDQMVKIKGNRVELGEIEWALCAHPSILEAAVIASKDGNLTAFVKASGEKVSTAEILRHCAGYVPSYMLPTEILYLDEMPRGSTGKIDRILLQRMKDDG